MKLTICDHAGTTSVHIDAEILENGDVRVSGHDIGAGPEECMRRDDYEYWLTIRKSQKNRLILALLEVLYRDDPTAVSRLRTALEERSIEHEFSCY